MKRDIQLPRDTRSQWQIDQGRACSCGGSDEYCPCQNVEKHYRGWRISFINPPIPIRSFDWQGTHPDYDGDEDGRAVHASTREGLLRQIDLWIEENV